MEMIFFILQIPPEGYQVTDTLSYFAAFDSLLSGHLHVERTPAYPLFVGSVRALFGSAEIYVIPILQSLLYLWSISWFRKLAFGLWDNRRLAFALTAVYALWPGILWFNCFIMTDVPPLSVMTGFLWLAFKAYRFNDLRAAMGAVLVMILLLAIRPVFLFLPFLFGLFWLLLMFRPAMRRVAAIALAGCVLAIGLTGLYTFGMYRTYGMKSPTLVSSYNNYWTFRCAYAINLTEIDNPHVAAVMDSILTLRPEVGTELDTWSEVHAFQARVSPAEYDRWMSDEWRLHRQRAFQFIRNERMSDALTFPGIYLGLWDYPHILYIMNMFSFPLSTDFLVIAAACLVLFIADIRRRQLSLFSWLILGVYISMAFVTIVGANADWGRLMIPATSPLLLAAGTLFLASARFVLRK